MWKETYQSANDNNNNNNETGKDNDDHDDDWTNKYKKEKEIYEFGYNRSTVLCK